MFNRTEEDSEIKGMQQERGEGIRGQILSWLVKVTGQLILELLRGRVGHAISTASTWATDDPPGEGKKADNGAW